MQERVPSKTCRCSLRFSTTSGVAPAGLTAPTAVNGVLYDEALV
jgi:hypothetical protein